MTNYFQSFDLTPSFAIDQAALEARYEQLMVLCHPDKFAGAATFEQRAAAKRAADVNEAYGVLRHAVRRAGHLLELHGVDLQELERQPASPDFLFEQMMLRERVQDFDSLTSSEASALVSDIESAYSETQNAFVRIMIGTISVVPVLSGLSSTSSKSCSMSWSGRNVRQPKNRVTSNFRTQQ